MLDPNPALYRGVRCKRSCKWCNRPLILIAPENPEKSRAGRLAVCAHCDNPYSSTGRWSPAPQQPRKPKP